MKPYKTSAYIIVILLVMLGLTFLSKKVVLDGEETSGFSFGGVVVKYPTTKDFFEEKVAEKPQTEEIDSIVDNIKQIVVAVDEEEELEEKELEADTVKIATIAEKIDTLAKQKPNYSNIPNFATIDTSKIQRIAYPGNAADFISKLRLQLEEPYCRIVHYGDSQLEGDRISAYLRNRLQGIFGGGGPGFIPIKQVYEQLSAVVNCSDNWYRYAAFDPTKDRFEHGKYGLYTTLSRFTKPLELPLDSINVDSLPLVKANFTVAVSKRTYAGFRKFTKVGMHYGNATMPVSVQVYNNDVLIKSDSLKADGKYHQLTIRLNEPPTNLRFEFEGKMSPDFYGVTLDAAKGLSLDNVAMRGASGTVFAKLADENFGSMVKTLKPSVFIFQYGGNTVPYLKDSLGVDKYSRYMLSNINWVRKKAPNATVLFIGPSDMTTSKDGVMFTYELLPYLNKKLKETCLANNIAYWDMYKAMGGKNSMQYWVDQGYAGADYTHFTAKGTKIISELFFISLYLDLSKQSINNIQTKITKPKEQKKQEVSKEQK